MQRNKSTKSEIIILIVLLTVLIAVIFWAYCVFTNKNFIKANSKDKYEKTYISKVNYELSDLSKYNILYSDKLSETSTYTATIKEVDNYIKDYQENIILIYNNISEEEQKELEDYCHKYDEIDYDYTLSCNITDNKLEINNTFYLESYEKSSHVKTEKKEFDLPVKYNEKFDEYQNKIGQELEKYEQLT